ATAPRERDPAVPESLEVHAATAKTVARNVRRRWRIDRNLVSLVTWSMTDSRIASHPKPERHAPRTRAARTDRRRRDPPGCSRSGAREMELGVVRLLEHDLFDECRDALLRGVVRSGCWSERAAICDRKRHRVGDGRRSDP